jgi:HAE1 family hydrophobic/amphiphilic exporter-1
MPFNQEDFRALCLWAWPGASGTSGWRKPVGRDVVREFRAKSLSGSGDQLHAALEYSIPFDTTPPITEGIREILITLVEAMILVVLAVFLFLQNWRATLIPMIAVPVSLIGTLAVFPLLGFSINTLSLFAFVLAIGLVVDDAIVVVEAVEHHIEEGMSPREATIRAMKEALGPVIAIALILASVFLPVAFSGEVRGRGEEARSTR